MVFINEWLPNPIGADAKGEFIELFNNGNMAVSLGGWSLSVDGKKKAKLSGLIRANGYLVLPRGKTKIALKNNDGKLFLYDVAGKVVDKSAFEGSALEGKSFNRINQNNSNVVQNFIWGVPTPEAKNSANLETGITKRNYPENIPLNTNHFGFWSLLGLVVGAGMIFGVILWYAIKKDADLRDLFFKRDQRSWQ